MSDTDEPFRFEGAENFISGIYTIAIGGASAARLRCAVRFLPETTKDPTILRVATSTTQNSGTSWKES